MLNFLDPSFQGWSLIVHGLSSFELKGLRSVGNHMAQQVDADRLLRLQWNHGEAMGMQAAHSGNQRQFAVTRITRNGDAGRAAANLLLIIQAKSPSAPGASRVAGSPLPASAWFLPCQVS
ncbi:TPA: hypothetical protein ACGRWA_001805 [Pseudomonas aeruginosa]